MAELRELTTRFGFEVDRSGVQKFNSAITGMRRQITGLAGVFGVGIGSRQLLETAKSAEQAEAALRGATAGFPGGAELVIESIQRVRDELNELKTGAGQIITDAEGKAIGASFFGAFEDFSKEGVATFETFLGAALKLSLQTGAEVTQVFSAIQQSAISGSVEPLRQLPGITEAVVRQFAFLTGLIDGIDPSGVAQISINIARMRDVIDEISPSIDKFISTLPEGLLKAREASATVETAIAQMSKKILDVMAEPLGIMSKFVQQLTDGKGAADAFSIALSGIELPPGFRKALELAGLLPKEKVEVGQPVGVEKAAISIAGQIFEFLGIDIEEMKRASRARREGTTDETRIKPAAQLTPGQQTVNQPRAAIVQVPGQAVPAVGPPPPVVTPGDDKTVTINVIHEGKVTTVTNINEVRDVVGDVVEEATVEFERAETTP